MGATHAKLGRLSAHRYGLWARVFGKNASHAINAQFPKAIDAIILGFHGNAFCLKSIRKPWVIFFDDYAAFHAFCKRANLFQWKWITHSKLENACFGGGVARMVIADSCGDDAEFSAAIFNVCGAFLLVPLREFHELIA